MDRDAVSFAFDIGTNSIGWSVFALDDGGRPVRIVAAGVRVFSSPAKGGTRKQPAAERRAARSASRRRDRNLRRRKAFLRELVATGLLPPSKADYENLIRRGQDRRGRDHLSIEDPYVLRARALLEPLAPYQIGRALFHLSRTRGRIGSQTRDFGESGQTRGEILAQLRVRRQAVRQRPIGGAGLEKCAPDIAGSRVAAELEFLRIWSSQARHHEALMSNDRRDRLFRILFHERPQRRASPGFCRFLHGNERALTAHPLFQRFRILKELNEVGIIEPDDEGRPLSIGERDRLVHLLSRRRWVTWQEMRMTLELPAGCRFTKEIGGCEGLRGDETAAILHKREFAGSGWYELGLKEQSRQFESLVSAAAENAGIAAAVGIRKQPVSNMLRLLPGGRCRYSIRALEALVAEMGNAVVREFQAARRCGFHDRQTVRRADIACDELPPYRDVLFNRTGPARTGAERIGNDVIHVALNQLRRVCNALIRRFGKPERISMETMRNPAPRGSAGEEWHERREARRHENSLQAAQFARLRERLANIADTRRNRLKFTLWRELNPVNPAKRICIYTGNVISAAQLFSSAVEIDHITPRSVSRDNGRQNLTVCFAQANRLKGARLPGDCVEWAGNYEAMKKRARILPEIKAMRFASAGPGPDADDDLFPPRQLADARRLTKLARTYLACLFDGRASDTQEGRMGYVFGVAGRVTGRLRRAWGLDAILSRSGEGLQQQGKNRSDHRQHAIDAMIIGAVSGNPTFEVLSSARGGKYDLHRGPVPLPWPGFIDEVRRLAEAIVVSHKADHGKARGEDHPRKNTSFGRLHNESAYGLTGEIATNGRPLVVRRKALRDLRQADLKKIRDRFLRHRLCEFTKGKSGREFAARLAAFPREDAIFGGIRRIRLAEGAKVIPIRDREGRVYKAYKGNSNFRYDVWQLCCSKWVSEVTTTHDAHQRQWTSPVRATHHNPKKVMSLKQQDMVAIQATAGDRQILRVVKFSRDGRICFAPHNEAGELKSRDADPCDPFRYIVMAASSLKAAGARQIRIDELGNICDPGPRPQA